MSTEKAAAAPSAGLDANVIFFVMLLVLVPAACVSHFFFPGTNTFVLCCLALIPLARYMGEATEVLAHRLGAGWGGFLNASFGNAAELIIAIVAMKEGQTEVVKASITGAILGNILLVLGMAIVAGGLRREKQSFNVTAALSGSGMMYLAVVALMVPALFHWTQGETANSSMLTLSVGISLVLLSIYGLSLFFALRTHKHIYLAEDPNETEGLRPWKQRTAIAILLAATVAVVVVAEFLIGALEPAIESFGFTHTFVGVIVIAIVGNAAEHSTAVLMALKNKMDLAFNISFESAKQIAMFVAPVLVLVSIAIQKPLTLEFSRMEVVSIGVGVAGATLVGLDGESNWLEGVMLVGLYAILAVTFYFIP